MKKILLIEDDSAIADIYQTAFKKAHFEVQTLVSGQDAVKKMKNIESGNPDEVKPDVVLLDLVLPDINGMEVLSEIRKNPKTKDITVFILSNQEIPEQNSPDAPKPDKFIIKANITPSQLVDLIEKQT